MSSTTSEVDIKESIDEEKSTSNVDNSTTSATNNDETKKSTSTFFKSSKLSGAAEKLWQQRKTEFADNDRSKMTTSFDLSTKKLVFNNNKNGNVVDVDTKSINNDCGFVFGARVADRVVADQKVGCCKIIILFDKANIDRDSNSNGIASATSLFHQLAAQAEKCETINDNNDTDQASTSNKLKQSAEHVEKAKKSVLLPDVTVYTGEEDEKNIFHTSCKLHFFDNTSKSWQERGHATIRINERSNLIGDVETRIVGRTTGCQRVVLNTKIWPEMLLEKMNAKCLKLSAMNPESVIPLLVLITASEQNTETMHYIIDMKINALIRDRKRRLVSNVDDDDDESVVDKKSARLTTPSSSSSEDK